MGSTRSRAVELAKERGYFFPALTAEGGVSGFYVYGPQGASFKRNLEGVWRERFVDGAGNHEIEAPTVTPETIFEVSGHLGGFDDMLVTCTNCGAHHRSDHLIESVTDMEGVESLPNPEVENLIREHDIKCKECGIYLAGIEVEDFNLMFKTHIGPGSSSPAYLRPETAQDVFSEFSRLKEYSRDTLPVAYTQIGRAYRNEIDPSPSPIRTREFTLAEIEHFIDPERDEADLSGVADIDLLLYPAEKQRSGGADYLETTVREALDSGVIQSAWIAYYLGVAKRWYQRVGIDMDRFRYRQHLAGERAHYASDCWDAEVEIDGDWIEISGFAYRGDYDLRQHEKHGNDDLRVFQRFEESKPLERTVLDPDIEALRAEFGGRANEVVEALVRLAETESGAFENGDTVEVTVDGDGLAVPIELVGLERPEEDVSGEQVMPHVVEPTFGVDRVLFAILCHSYTEDVVDGEERTYLSLPIFLAPTTVAVFSLVDNDDLIEYAREVVESLRHAGFSVTFVPPGNVSSRYRRQDEIGTPFCATVDFRTLENDTLRLRERDSTERVRVGNDQLQTALNGLLEGDTRFEDIEE